MEVCIRVSLVNVLVLLIICAQTYDTILTLPIELNWYVLKRTLCFVMHYALMRRF